MGPWWNGWVLERQLTDPHESMAYLARSLTHAVGAEPRTQGVIEGPGVDLFATFGFDDGPKEHSAQFNRPIQRGLMEFYLQLMGSLEVNK